MEGRPWAQSLRVSYVGDVLRDVPEATVYSPYSDMGWRKGGEPGTARPARGVQHVPAVQ